VKIAEHRARVAVALLVIVLLGLLIFGFERGWLSGEPTYRGRTTTEWLDKLLLYEYRTEPEATWIVLRAPEAVVRDPAYQALTRIGSQGIPVFIKVLSQRAEWPPEISGVKRWKMWIQWRWRQLRGSQASRPAPIQWSEAQKVRKTAAGFALVALGTNGGGGFSKYLELYAAAPKHQSVYGTGVAGAPVGVSSSQVVRSVLSVMPQKGEEIIREVLAALRHTNVWQRCVALECARVFPEELLRRRKQDLVNLTRDEDAMVQEAALGSLCLIAQTEALGELMPPAEVVQACYTVLQNPLASQRVRELAQTVFNLATNREAVYRPMQ
jgi:hypothetical protein